MLLLCENETETGEKPLVEFNYRSEHRLYQVDFQGGTGQVLIKGRLSPAFAYVVVADVSNDGDLSLPIQIFPEMIVDVVAVSGQVSVGIDGK